MAYHSTGARTPLYTFSRLRRLQKHKSVETQSIIHPSSQPGFPREATFHVLFPENVALQVARSKWDTCAGVSSRHSCLLRNWLTVRCIPCWSNSIFYHLHLCPCALQPLSTITGQLQVDLPSFLFLLPSSSFTDISIRWLLSVVKIISPDILNL